jgi:hypothetical protein
MEYTIVKQVIGEIDIKHFSTLKELDECVNAICLEMSEEGIEYKPHRVHQDRWGARLLYEIHAEDGCIYSVFKNVLYSEL